MAKCIHQQQASHSTQNSGRPVALRVDILDASAMVDRHPYPPQDPKTAMPVFVTVRMVEWFKRLGNEEAVEKLKRAVNLGVATTKHSCGNRKSNFIADPVPAEYLTVEKYYATEKTPGLLIDCIPLQNADLLLGDW